MHTVVQPSPPSAAELFHLPKWKLHLLNTKLPIPLLQPLATTALFSVFDFDHSGDLL